MKFGMPSKKYMKYGLYLLLLGGVITGLVALFMGVISITIQSGSLESGNSTDLHIRKNGNYFQFLQLQSKYTKIVDDLNNQGSQVTYSFTYSPFQQTSNTFDSEQGSIVPGILPIHNAGGILPTPALGPGPVMPSSGSLDANNS